MSRTGECLQWASSNGPGVPPRRLPAHGPPGKKKCEKGPRHECAAVGNALCSQCFEAHRALWHAGTCFWKLNGICFWIEKINGVTGDLTCMNAGVIIIILGFETGGFTLRYRAPSAVPASLTPPPTSKVLLFVLLYSNLVYIYIIRSAVNPARLLGRFLKILHIVQSQDLRSVLKSPQ